MKFLKLDLLTLLISLFILASCENSSTIGLEVDPSSAIQGNLVDTVTIVSKTEQDDDGVTYSTNAYLNRYPFGFINDPILGSTEANLALSVSLPYYPYDFGTAAVLDSAVLILNYAGEFYGDSTSNYNIDVHRLTNNISKENSYLSSNTYPYESALLGNYTGKVYPTSPFQVMDVLTGEEDTLMTVIPQLRIKLDENFVTNNVLNLPASVLKHNTYFQNSLKGLHVQIRASSQASMGNGGLMFFDFSSAGSGLMLYFRRENASIPAQIDTVSVNFPVVTSPTSAVAASIKHNHSVQVQQQLDNPSVQYPITYLKPMAGLRNRIAFPYLANLKTDIGKLVVNKAELIIDLSTGSDAVPFRAAPRLALYRYDIAGQRKNLPDNDIGDGYYTIGDIRANPAAFGGYFDSIKKRYVFVVTSYIQDLIDGKTEDYGTFISVTPSATFQYAPSFNVASRAVIGSFKKTPTAGDNVMKLNIYYTKID